MCAARGAKLCLDCISTIGTMPVDLSGVYLASGSSGKGLRAYPGLAMVFYHHEVAPAPDRLPRYLDLGLCAQEQGIPFTFSSNLLHALHAAVRRVNLERRFEEIAGLSAGLRLRLAEMGFDLVGKDTQTSPAVITIALPPEMNSIKIGEAMQEAGYLLSYNSEYLRRKNWIQICLMGECPREKIVPVANALNRVCFPTRIFARRHCLTSVENLFLCRRRRKGVSELAPQKQKKFETRHLVSATFLRAVKPEK